MINQVGREQVHSLLTIRQSLMSVVSIIQNVLRVSVLLGPDSEGYARHLVMSVSDQASLRRVDKLNWLSVAILKAAGLFELLLLGPL